MFVLFRWKTPAERGTYVRIEAEQIGDDERIVERRSVVVGHRDGPEPPIAMLPVSDRANSLRLSWQNAYHHGPITLEDVWIEFVSAAPGGACPTGAVGLIADGPHQMARLVAEMVDHYPHYRETAAAYSRPWGDWHNPDRVVSELIERGAAGPPIESGTKKQRHTMGVAQP